MRLVAHFFTFMVISLRYEMWSRTPPRSLYLCYEGRGDQTNVALKCPETRLELFSSAVLEVEESLALTPGEEDNQLTSHLLAVVVQSHHQHLRLLSCSGAELHQHLQWRAGRESSQIIPENVLSSPGGHEIKKFIFLRWKFLTLLQNIKLCAKNHPPENLRFIFRLNAVLKSWSALLPEYLLSFIPITSNLYLPNTSGEQARISRRERDLEEGNICWSYKIHYLFPACRTCCCLALTKASKTPWLSAHWTSSPL